MPRVRKPISRVLVLLQKEEKELTEKVRKLSPTTRTDPVAYDTSEALRRKRTKLRLAINHVTEMLDKDEEQGDKQADPDEDRVQMQVLKSTRDKLRTIALSRDPTTSMVREVADMVQDVFRELGLPDLGEALRKGGDGNN